MCNRFPTLLASYLEDEQMLDSRTTLVNHVRDCDECQILLARLPQFEEPLRAVPPAPDLWPGIAARMAKPKLHWRRVAR